MTDHPPCGRPDLDDWGPAAANAVAQAADRYLAASKYTDGGRPILPPGTTELILALADCSDAGTVPATMAGTGTQSRWVSVGDAARLADVSEEYVRRLARHQPKSPITAHRFGTQWQIDLDSLENFARGRRARAAD